jgi:hypothetical protein
MMPSPRSLAALACALFATAAAAQPAALGGAKPAAAAPSFTVPRAYQGYSQPEITQCVASPPLQRVCTVPAMTAGRYLIIAVGSATATGAKSTQGLSIRLDNNEPCESINPVTFTGKKALRAACVATFLTDQPVSVTAVYAVEGATPDAAGPQLILRRVPWNGVVEARPIVLPAPKPPPAAPAKP